MNVPFKIEMTPCTLTKEQTFSCPTAHGVVPPGEKKHVSVFFHPETLDVRTMDYLSIMPSGCASRTVLKVIGFCRGTGNPRTLHFPEDRSSPRLGMGNVPCPLMRAGGVLVLSLGVCCPLVGSVRKHLRTPGDCVPAPRPW